MEEKIRERIRIGERLTNECRVRKKRQTLKKISCDSKIMRYNYIVRSWSNERKGICELKRMQSRRCEKATQKGSKIGSMWLDGVEIVKLVIGTVPSLK